MVSWARQESVRLGALSLLIESATPTYYGNQADTLDLGLREPLLEVRPLSLICIDIGDQSH